jgi:penicillin-binding protein 2
VQEADTMGMNVNDRFPVPDELTKVEIDRSTGALRGFAGLAPEPGCIFCYLKKSQIAQAGSNLPPQERLGKPRDWTNWLCSFYNQADETQQVDDPLIYDDKRSDIIPVLAEYKMPGLRGNIMSDDGKIYATMAPEKNLMLTWPATDEVSDTQEVVRWMRSRLEQIQALLNVPVEINDDNLARAYKVLRFQPYFVLENLTNDQIQKIQDAGWLSKGFGIQTIPRRTYPQGDEMCHLLGYLGQAQKVNRYGKYLSGDVLYDRYRGQTGLELLCNDDLTGQDGQFDVATTPDGYVRSAAVNTPSTNGNNVRLCINGEIEAIVNRALDLDKLDAAVMMDVNTGDIVALAAHPTYDPNIFVPAISADNWKALDDDPTKPLICRAYAANYPPGSAFKTITSVAAMRAGVFDPDWVVHCTGTFDIGNVTYHLPLEHGDITYKEALTHSFNTYFMTLGLKIGRDILLDTARSFGLGAPTNFGIAGEASGRIPDPEFMRRVEKREFGPGDVTNTSIGQGDVLVTPLQMCAAMGALANGGTVYRPRLVRQVEDGHGTIIKAIPVVAARSNQLDSPFMQNLKDAMINVVDDGTATVAKRDDMKIAAKTGTAQVPVNKKPRQIAWLCGYLPADNPKYCFAIMVEGTVDQDLHGGVHAGAIAKAIFDGMFDKKPPAPQPAEH